MKTRTRSRSLAGSQGQFIQGGSPPTISGPFSYQARYSEIVDSYDKIMRFDGSLPPSDLFIMKESMLPLTVSFTKIRQSDGYLAQQGKSLPCVTVGTGKTWVKPSDWALNEKLSESALVAKLLANTNPFRYEVSIPVMVFELLEVSTLLKLNLNDLFSSVGSGHLNYQFGIRPMVEDIRKLLNITKSIESRIQEFNSLVKKGGLRRTMILERGSQSWVGPGQAAWSTHGITFSSVRVSCDWSSLVYGSVRWRPKRTALIEVKQLSDFNRAAAIVLDVQKPDLSTIWEAIPFSWLVDYFLNVGDTLQALESSDLVEPYDVCIMRHRKTSTLTEGANDTTYAYGYATAMQSSTGVVKQEYKLRKVITNPSGYSSLLTFGILTPSQAMNLVALLFSQRGYNKRR